MRTLPIAVLAAFLAACSSGGGSSTPRLPDPSEANAVIDGATSAGTCPGGTEACGGSGYCCPTGTACLANPGNTYGCGAGYCCLGCTAGTTCGAGCCASGTSCVGNPGGATGCGGGQCCSPTADPECPADVAAQCATGTRCLANHSAKSCAGGFACYLPSGVVGCPGETMCPNAVDFCPSGTHCGSVSGTCLHGSSSGNYCCVAESAESCDTYQCASGLWCVDNPHCANSAPNAAKTCRGTCSAGYPVDCGTFCCGANTSYCGASDTCTCYFYY